MRQLSLDALFGTGEREVVRLNDGRLEVFDLFCGGGGFSCGSTLAGCRVVWASDMDEAALDTHRLNHPECVHSSEPLPHNRIPFPNDGRPFHVHGSPPCQRFSSACTKKRKAGDRGVGEALIEWFLTTAMTCGATSWTMEEVGSTHVVEIVEEFRKKHPRRVAYEIFHFEELGVPQTRHRLIAGSPELIAKLLRMRDTQPRRSIADVVPHPRGTHIRTGNYSVSRKKKTIPDGRESMYIYQKAELGDSCHSIYGPSPTILAGFALGWVTKTDGKAHSRLSLTPRESALIQTFPTSYKFPASNKLALMHAGNAVPPLVATLLMRPSPRQGRRPLSPSLVIFPE